MPELNIPFPGFYNSYLSDMLDREIEMFCENFTDDQGESWPDPLHIDPDDYIWRATDHSAGYDILAREYVEQFDALAGEALDESRVARRKAWRDGALVSEKYRADSCGMKFSTMTSPREYNFETDRLFVDVSQAFINRLWKMSRADSHDTLRAVIKRRFTSRDGFISHYRNRLDDWPRDLRDWDYNQLGTLLIACLELSDMDEETVMWAMLENSESSYAAFDATMAYDTFGAYVIEERAEKLAEWIDEDPERAGIWIAHNPDKSAPLIAELPSDCALPDMPYRCTKTPDLFA